jgi:ferredoxin
MAHPWRRKPTIKVDNTLCEKCGICVKVCPVGAISMQTLILRRNQSQLPMSPKRFEEEGPIWQRHEEWVPEAEE